MIKNLIRQMVAGKKQRLFKHAGISLFLLLMVVCSYGQIRFEKGYFITNENQRTECLIKNVDWKNNPHEFLYKLKDRKETQKGTIQSVKEFGIYGYSIFVRSQVKIDRSGNDINFLDENMNPVWTDEQLFLHILVRGHATLYSYEDGNLKRFFYSLLDSAIGQLVYKKYLVPNPKYNFTKDSILYPIKPEKTYLHAKPKFNYNQDSNRYFITTNLMFRLQLWDEVSCDSISQYKTGKLRYTQTDLVNYFLYYNKCMGDRKVMPVEKLERDFYSLKVAAGFNRSTLSISNSMLYLNHLKFAPVTGFYFGLESEIIIPYNRNKWSVLFDPGFQYINSSVNNNSATASLNYKSIDFPLGVRYYSFLTHELKFFVNGFYISNYAVNFKTKLTYGNTLMLDVATRTSFAVGAGMEFKRLSAEVRYYSKRDILGDYIYWSSNYSRLSLLLGVKLIRIKHIRR